MFRTNKQDIAFALGLIGVAAWLIWTGLPGHSFWIGALYLQLWIFLKVHRENRALRATVENIRALRYGRGSYPLPETANPCANDLIREYNLVYAALDREKLNANRAHSRIEDNVWRRTQELNQQLRQVSQSAQIDDLSGLANRKSYEQKSQELFDKAVKSNTDLSCVMIDVDHFKETNDQWGHAAGDKVIAFIGELLRASTRGTDLCVRYGGDEFILVLPNCAIKNAAATADRIRRLFAREVELYISDHCRQTIRPEDIMPRLSIGLASLHRDRPLTFEQLKQMSDAALYKAKQKGRNQLAVYA